MNEGTAVGIAAPLVQAGGPRGWGDFWERGSPGLADSVSPLAALVPGFSLILHGSSTGPCDL